MSKYLGRSLVLLVGMLILMGVALSAQLPETQSTSHSPRAIVAQTTPESTACSASVEPQRANARFPSTGGLQLQASIRWPTGDGPFPAILWSHGSERCLGLEASLMRVFADHGYVILVPHRRGQGQSPGAYIDDLLGLTQPTGPTPQSEPSILAPTSWYGWQGEHSRLFVALQDAHLEDTLAGLTYLQRLANIDQNRIAVAGCSYGGIQTLLAAERNLGLRAAVSFAAAVQTWGPHPELRGRLLSAASRTTIPALIVQAENDYDKRPPLALAEELQKHSSSSALYMPTYGDNAEEAHTFCRTGSDTWGPTVFAFLAAAMR